MLEARLIINEFLIKDAPQRINARAHDNEVIGKIIAMVQAGEVSFRKRQVAEDANAGVYEGRTRGHSTSFDRRPGSAASLGSPQGTDTRAIENVGAAPLAPAAVSIAPLAPLAPVMLAPFEPASSDSAASSSGGEGAPAALVAAEAQPSGVVSGEEEIDRSNGLGPLLFAPLEESVIDILTNEKLRRFIRSRRKSVNKFDLSVMVDKGVRQGYILEPATPTTPRTPQTPQVGAEHYW